MKTKTSKSLVATVGKSFVASLFLGLAIFFCQALVNLMRNPNDIPITDEPKFVGFVVFAIGAFCSTTGVVTFILWAFGTHPRDVFFKK